MNNYILEKMNTYYQIRNIQDNISRIYIHLRKEDFDSNSAIGLFNKMQKEQYEKTLSRYKQRYLENLHISAKTKEAMEFTAKLQKDGNLIDIVDKQLKNHLDNTFQKQLTDSNLKTQASIANKSIKSYFNNKDIKEFDKILECIEIVGAEIFGDTNVFMSFIQELRKDNTSTKELETKMDKMIQKYEGQMIKFSSTANSVIKKLQTLIKNINGDITLRSLQTSVTNIFSTELGEYFTQKTVGIATDASASEIEKSLLGAKDVKLSKNENIFFKQHGSQSKRYKTDNSIKRFSLNVEEKEKEFNVILDLGLSVKWYQTVNGDLDKSVTVASETSFMHRIRQAFDMTNNANKYLIYNSLALTGQDNSMYLALKAAIVARNIDVLISGLGVQGDFSQMIVVNGKFYSVYDIIKALKDYNGAGTSSDDDQKGVLTASATGLSKIINMNTKVGKRDSLYKAFIRSQKIEKELENLHFDVHFYPNKLGNMLNNSLT